MLSLTLIFLIFLVATATRTAKKYNFGELQLLTLQWASYFLVCHEILLLTISLVTPSFDHYLFTNFTDAYARAYDIPFIHDVSASLKELVSLLLSFFLVWSLARTSLTAHALHLTGQMDCQIKASVDNTLPEQRNEEFVGFFDGIAAQLIRQIDNISEMLNGFENSVTKDQDLKSSVASIAQDHAGELKAALDDAMLKLGIAEQTIKKQDEALDRLYQSMHELRVEEREQGMQLTEVKQRETSCQRVAQIAADNAASLTQEVTRLEADVASLRSKTQLMQETNSRLVDEVGKATKAAQEKSFAITLSHAGTQTESAVQPSGKVTRPSSLKHRVQKAVRQARRRTRSKSYVVRDTNVPNPETGEPMILMELKKEPEEYAPTGTYMQPPQLDSTQAICVLADQMDEEWDQLESEQEEERGDEDEEMMEVDWEQEREDIDAVKIDPLPVKDAPAKQRAQLPLPPFLPLPPSSLCLPATSRSMAFDSAVDMFRPRPPNPTARPSEAGVEPVRRVYRPLLPPQTTTPSGGTPVGVNPVRRLYQPLHPSPLQRTG